MVCKNCGKENLDTRDTCLYCKQKIDGKISTINDIVNDKISNSIDNSKNKNGRADNSQKLTKNRLLELSAILTFLFNVGFFVLVVISGVISEFLLWGIFIVPFTLCTILGFYLEKPSITMIGSIMHFAFMLLITIEAVKTISIICMFFSIIIFFMSLLALLSKK